jgi:hypothetical protein
VGSGGSNPDYVVTPDGQRFLVNTFVEQPAVPLTMILNCGESTLREGFRRPPHSTLLEASARTPAV